MVGPLRRQAGPDQLLTNRTLVEAFGGTTGPSGAGGSRVGTFDEAADEAEEIPRVFSLKGAGSSFGAGANHTSLPSSQAFGAWPGASSWGNHLLLHPTPSQEAGLPAFGSGLGNAPMASGSASWVTVFGFPGRAASGVRQQLEAVCGPIVEVCYGEGNFMHVCFGSPQAASACLALNGQLLLGKIMVGCIPCTHAALLAGESEQPEPCVDLPEQAVAPLAPR
ncbi:unnamed protein product [Durusdinium trenchii]|uniref:RRM Nup35-type domain-containing protein n=1 Tax=Durusdinium trenchii TaxID=1381693 RepID=A0ABP0P467_9DINO